MSSSLAPCCIRSFFIFFPDIKANPLVSKISFTSFSVGDSRSTSGLGHSLFMVSENKPLNEMKKKIIKAIFCFVDQSPRQAFSAFIEG